MIATPYQVLIGPINEGYCSYSILNAATKAELFKSSGPAHIVNELAWNKVKQLINEA